MTWLLFLLAYGATARITRLITDDILTAPFRGWVAKRFGADSKLGYLVECPWCLSIYAAALVFTIGWLSTGRGHHQPALWFTVPTAALGASYLHGIVSGQLDGE